MLVDAHGVSAIHLIVSSVHPLMVKLWDGSLERFFFVYEASKDKTDVTVFPDRAFAVRELRGRALLLDPALAEKLRRVLDFFDSAPKASGVECIICGWNDCVSIEITAEDLRPGRRPQLSPVEVSSALIAGQTQKSALDEIVELRKTVDLVELAALEQLIRDRWDDHGALAIALARAQDAAAARTSDAAGQRASLVLMLLADAIGQRAGHVNAGGGDA
jgi:hypothetical protein